MISLISEEDFKLNHFSDVSYDSPKVRKSILLSSLVCTCCADFSLIKHHVRATLGLHASVSQQHPPHKDQNRASCCLHIWSCREMSNIPPTPTPVSTICLFYHEPKSAWNTQQAQTNTTPKVSFYDTELLLMHMVFPENIPPPRLQFNSRPQTDASFESTLLTFEHSFYPSQILCKNTNC